ncbi:lipoyl synthase [Elusimicrobiota bacterium]
MNTWLNKKIEINKIDGLKSIISDLGLNTICTQALCPNISECYEKRNATFLILGRTCTRNCAFCGVAYGKPSQPDPDEPERIAIAIKRLNLKHAVITSPARDDLDDGGAGHFSNTVSVLKNSDPALTIELLIPDFNGKTASILKVADSKPDIIGHNIETVQRLYAARNSFMPVRSRNCADYSRSLSVLKKIKGSRLNMMLKSGIMLGLGETGLEVTRTIKDIADTGCKYLSIGQYLAPGKGHLPVREYIHPDIFIDYKAEALSMGFIHVESGPYVRSSYNAAQYIRKAV